MKIIKEIILKSMGNKTIRYNMLESKINGKTTYGIKIYEKYKERALEEAIEGISDSKEDVLNLINYLSENVVDTAHFKDIVEDYMY